MNKNELISRCDALYIWHKEPIYRMALKAVGGDQEWALEILDTCMMTAYQYIDKFDDIKSERSKSIMAAIFLSILDDIYRTAKEQMGIAEEFRSPMITKKEKLDIDQVLIRNDLSAELIKYVEKLTHKERELVFFRFFVGLNEEEVSEHFHIGLEEMKDRLFLVKQKISNMMIEGS